MENQGAFAFLLTHDIRIRDDMQTEAQRLREKCRNAYVDTYKDHSETRDCSGPLYDCLVFFSSCTVRRTIRPPLTYLP